MCPPSLISGTFCLLHWKSFMANVHSIVLFALLWPKKPESGWKEKKNMCRPHECKSGRCRLQIFRLLILALNVKHLRSSAQLASMSCWNPPIPLGVFWYSVYATFSLYAPQSPTFHFLCLSQFFPASLKAICYSWALLGIFPAGKKDVMS